MGAVGNTSRDRSRPRGRGWVMLPLCARRADGAPLRLLVIGAHSDDIEIGCGGTLLKLLEQRSIQEICWVVLTGGTSRAAEAAASADALLSDLPDKRVILKDFRDGFLPYERSGGQGLLRAAQA